ncbi:MAG: PQQ-binding-like beta-propeller repeat protein [Planctomycetes bacterium]|nr:PQQ-binding-like beta-propeller repeat protein [Planctomycetota bacterium]
MLLGALGTCLLASSAGGEEAADRTAAARRFWPAWRGPLGTGVAPEGDPPTEWSEEKNIRWKVDVPGLGHSTPIVWGDLVFLATAVPTGEALPPIESKAPGAHDGVPVTHRHQFVALALRRRDGKVAWERTLKEALPLEGGHYTASLASSSPVTDGERVVFLLGSYGLYALDFSGELLWSADLGTMRILHGHGEASSPVLHGDTLAINWDHEGQSFVTAFDVRSGKERWRTPRDEMTTWATPIVVEHGGRALLIASGTSRVRGYDLATGKVIWECGGLSANVVASPVAGHGMVFAGSSYDVRALLAIRLEGAQGDITGTDRVAWQRSRGTPYVPSPLLYGEALYFLAHYQGIISRVDAKTGRDQPGPFRLQGIGNVYASPVAAAGRVYVTDLDGTTVVIEHADALRIVARSSLNESFAASAAIAGRELFLRGRRSLYSIESR